jgi:hypothetical protein
MYNNNTSSKKRVSNNLHIIPKISNHDRKNTSKDLTTPLTTKPSSLPSKNQNSAQKSQELNNSSMKKSSSIVKKEIKYKDPKIKIGNGKLGPVELIIYKDELFALKRIPKRAIDKPKIIQHLKNEKNILNMLKQIEKD